MKKIFIGSSSESQKYLDVIRDILSREFEIIAWNDPEVFSLNNQSFLDSLIKQSYLVDFAIFLATGDDITNSRGHDQKAPRDNVIFEFGMFLQSLGKERCFMLVEADSKILSDMKGITFCHFRQDDKMTNFRNSLSDLKNNLLQKKKHIPSLVTTGLAYGYYANFVKKLASWSQCEKLIIHLHKSQFNSNQYQKHDGGGYELPVRQAFHDKNNATHFFDYPTTLDTIDYIINDKSELSEEEKVAYRIRELTNFKVVLERLMENENFNSKVKFLRT